MSKPVLFIHGAGDGAHQEDRAMVANLQEGLGSSYSIHYPPMPQEATPGYSLWRDRLARELAELESYPILVGHSLGASVLLKYVSEEVVEQNVCGLFLLAPPYWGAEDWQVEAYTLKDDFAANLPETIPIFFYHSRSDTIVPFSHLGFYKEVLPQAIFRDLEKEDPYGGHQFGNDLTEVAEDIRSLAREEKTGQRKEQP